MFSEQQVKLFPSWPNFKSFTAWILAWTFHLTHTIMMSLLFDRSGLCTWLPPSACWDTQYHVTQWVTWVEQPLRTYRWFLHVWFPLWSMVGSMWWWGSTTYLHTCVRAVWPQGEWCMLYQMKSQSVSQSGTLLSTLSLALSQHNTKCNPLTVFQLNVFTGKLKHRVNHEEENADERCNYEVTGRRSSSKSRVKWLQGFPESWLRHT